MKLVTINEYSSFVEAHLDKTRLENEGIAVILLDQNVSALYPFTNPNLIGIRMQVREQDASKAYQLLAMNQIPQLQCPQCYSSDLKGVHRLGKFKRWWLLAASLLFALAPPVPMGSQCQQCGHQFA